MCTPVFTACMVIAAYATAVRLTAAAPINLAAAATLASRPAALAALDALPAADLAAKAERLDMTPAELRELIQTSEAINFDAESGYLHYRCDFGGHAGGPNAKFLVFPDEPPGTTNNPAVASFSSQQLLVDPGLADPATSQAFKLHSRPGAPRTIYLDFNGHVTTGTRWNRAPCNQDPKNCHSTTNAFPPSFTTEPFDLDGNTNSFSAAELAAIVKVWLNVAEDYAPFNVDVTTEEPTFSLARGVGIRVVIGGSDLDWYAIGYTQSIAGGVAYVSSFGDGNSGAGFPSGGNEVAPCFVWSKVFRNNLKSIWEAASHEAGHTFGLRHHGRVLSATNAAEEYYRGHATWAPIMGTSYSRNLTQWSRGDYQFASRPAQDDLAVIANRAPLVPDDVGGAPSSAFRLTNVSNVAGQSFVGLISNSADSDIFSFQSGPGSITVRLQLASATPVLIPSPTRVWERTNLDAQVVISRSDGSVLSTLTNSDGFLRGTLATVALPTPGTYFLTVRGTGQGADATTGYTSYGSIGQYTLTVVAQSVNSTGTVVTCSTLKSVQLPQTAGGSCSVATLKESDIYTAVGGADVTITPALPSDLRFRTGSYSYSIAGTSGVACTVAFTVAAGPSCASAVTCTQGTKVVALEAGSCSGVKIDRDDLFTGGGADPVVTPPLPDDLVFPPSKTKTYRVVSSADSKSRCFFKLQVQPCTPQCVTPPVSQSTAAGKCATGKISNPKAPFVDASIGSTVTSLKLSPAGSLKAGRQKVTGTVKYAGGVSVKASCDFVVDDEEAPAVKVVPKSGEACAWPKPGQSSACYLPKELVKVTDNCRPLPAPAFVSCVVTSNGAAADCYREAGTGRVCLNYPAAGAAEPRVALATFVAVDAFKNASPDTNVTLTAYGAKPVSSVPGCKPR